MQSQHLQSRRLHQGKTRKPQRFPPNRASGVATATITIRPRASGSRYAPTATYSQRPSKLLAVDRCATAAGVDPQRWPRAFVMVAVGRAHCFGTASSPEIFRSRSAPADRGRSGHGVGRPRAVAAGRRDAAVSPPRSRPLRRPSSRAGRRTERRRSPCPNPARGAAALTPSPARRSQR